MTEQLQAEQAAPNFIALDNTNKKVSLGDFTSHWLVLYFYPKDDTPGCTIEAIDFTRYLKEFTDLGVKIVGVSPDSVESHCQFIDKHSLGITLLSDPEHHLAESYAAWGLKNFMGKESYGIIRSTFVIDPMGKIAKAWYSVKAQDHAEAVLKYLKTLVSK